MDEHQYRSTYHSINPDRCVFEKAINSRVCNCNKAQRFNLADREGVACNSKQGRQRCSVLISRLHSNARFVFQHVEINQIPAHTEEIKIQNGGLLGLQSLVSNSNQGVKDIDSLLDDLVSEYKNLKKLPYSKLMQFISNYQLRPRRNRLRKNNH